MIHPFATYILKSAPVEWSNLPFAEAVEFFREKLNMPTASWMDIIDEATQQGFWTAGAMSADLLEDMRDAVDRAINEGISLNEFRKSFDETVERYGWSYNGSRNWRSKLIYETNINTSYAQGRYKQQRDPEIVKLRPYLLYRHGGSKDFRHIHKQEWDGLILPADDDFWKSHYPPNGYGCSCRVYSLSERDLKRYGKTKPDKAPKIEYYEFTDTKGKSYKIPDGVDPGFQNEPGTFKPDLKKYPKEIEKQIKALVK